MAGPDDIEGVAVRGLTLHFTQEELDYAERVAWYRNFRADSLKVRLATRWSRKSVLESWARTAANGTRAQMEKLEAEYGPLPLTKVEVETYAKHIATLEAAKHPSDDE